MNKPEPPTTACPIAAAVAADVLARAEVGLRKYGVSLARPDLSRAQWLQHAYEEALDLAAYLKTLIEMECPPRARARDVPAAEPGYRPVSARTASPRRPCRPAASGLASDIPSANDDPAKIHPSGESSGGISVQTA